MLCKWFSYVAPIAFPVKKKEKEKKEKKIKDFVLWFIFTVPVQEILESCYNVKSYSHGPLSTRFVKPPEGSYNSVSPITWYQDHKL